MIKTGAELRTNSILKTAVIDAGVTWLALILFSMIVTVFIHNEYLGFDAISIIAPVSNFFAALSAMLVLKAIRRPAGVWVCISTFLTYFLTQLVVSMLLFDGIGANILPVVICSILGMLSGIYLEMQGNKRQRKGRRKVHSR